MPIDTTRICVQGAHVSGLLYQSLPIYELAGLMPVIAGMMPET